MTSLQVWLRGEHLGEVEQMRTGRARLRFSGAAVAQWGEGSRPLSLSLPVTASRLEGAHLDVFLDGLLPEGALRAQLENEYGTRTPFELLSRIGRECAGAVQFTLDDSRPGPGSLRALSDDEVAALVRDLPTLTPPDGLPIGASLGGVQAKLLLTRTREGWAWPTDGAVSTHIIKPQSLDPSGPALLVAAEHWAMQVAAAAGVPVAQTELHEFDGRHAIVVERYDRVDGQRTHQEDFTQALSVPSLSKYESTLAGSTRLRSIAALAMPNARDPRRFAARLFEAVAFNNLIGNGDAHSKNYSLTIDSAALVDVAPLYDVAPVMFLGRFHHAGHAVAQQTDLRYITRRHLIDEAQSWGLKPAETASALDDLVSRVARAIEHVESPDELADVVEKVASRVKSFSSEARL
jgi:serine/threonine-protein kinase HipA